MLQEFQVNISYWKAWRCRELALEKAFGSVSGSFALLPSYLKNLQNSNPGTVCKTEFGVDKNGCQRFKYLFISFAASIAGLQYLRPVVIIDDRHGSIYSGLKKVYPAAGHGACLVHLARNITARFKEIRLPGLMVSAAKAYTVYEFQQIFADLQSVSPGCANYFSDLGLPHWTRAYCIGERYNVMTTNVAESLNKVLKECREFPLILMLEAIWMSLISWFVRRKAASAAQQHGINPEVRDLMDDNFYSCTELKVVVVERMSTKFKTDRGKASSCSKIELDKLVGRCTPQEAFKEDGEDLQQVSWKGSQQSFMQTSGA
ncbi:uncharacterized protein LOC112085345 [Eutrema salsugineum]|uniref:uncharacterized protein LOC112085345 n=1 Tax=Eutrema salsugineum TaxID=72664 RepID=UPI000CED2712|nr:uncharacterized protein LOC112085345 [Eutrema salsugineum]